MKKQNPLFILFAAIIVSIGFSSCAEKAAEVETEIATVVVDMDAIKAEIQERENIYATAQSNGDVESIIALFTDDAISMGNDQEALIGKEAIRKDLEKRASGRIEGNTTTFEVTEVYGDEDVVTEVGISKTMNAEGELLSKGKYMAIWKKVDGEYLVLRDIYNDDAPKK